MRHRADGLLEWAPDFPTEAAVRTVLALTERESPTVTKAAARPRLETAFVDKHAPE
jgi:hypothetical protein